MARVLTPKGYAILKTDLTEDETEAMKEELTCVPKTNPRVSMGAAVVPFKIYRESPTRWYLPRAWAREKYGPEASSTVPEGVDLSETAKQFCGTPYDYQETIIGTFLDSGCNGLICVPCGKGKTFMALAIAARIGKRFLIVVDKEFLAEQWREEIQRYVPNLTVGILQGDKCQIGRDVIAAPEPTVAELKELARGAGLKVGGSRADLIGRLEAAGVKWKGEDRVVEYDCTICMIQTLCLHDLPDGTFANYGFTIFDECHHLGAAYFSRTLMKVQTPKMLGLSATPDREDGLTRVFEAFLGRPVYEEKTREPDPTVVVKGVMLDIKDADYQEVPTNWMGEPVMAKLLSSICENGERNREIIRWIRWLCDGHPARRVLVLSERISHLNTIELMLEGKYTVGYYIGGMKSEERNEGAHNVRVLLASYQMASEAMNIKSLNSVVFASPRKRVEQSSGRILRVKKEDRVVHPVIVDIIDSHTMYLSQWQKRMEYYRKCAYQIEKVKMGEIEGTVVKQRKRSIESLDGCLIDD
jgi:superfamily II DNA or RNA helicase